MNADVPPLGNSLKYYRTSFVGTSTANQATDHDKTILAQRLDACWPWLRIRFTK